MPAFFYKNQFPAIVSQTAQTGKWHRVTKQQGATHVSVNVDISSGTGTITLQGSATDPLTATVTNPVVIEAVTVSGGAVVGYFPYMRVVVSGGSALSAVVSIATPVKQIEA